jgi:phosphate transport system ATP-binding protein
MDEPCSALDPVSSARVEELIVELARKYTVLVVTHNLAQARRISSFTALFYAGNGCGELWEYGSTEAIFEAACRPETRDYVSGRIG